MTDETRQSPLEATSHASLKPGMDRAMEIIGNMRQAEAGLFDAKHSGQRGCDRSDALYDAYVAIRDALAEQIAKSQRPEPTQQPLTKEQAEDLTRRSV